MNWFRKHRVLSLIVALATPGLALAVLSAPDDGEKEVSVEELPDAIQKALKGLDIDEVTVTASGYEIEVNDVAIELRLDKDGRLLGLEIEEDGNGDADEENAKVVALTAVPAAARSAINKFAAGNAVEMVKQEKKGGHELFEALWKINGVEHEATVTAQGVLVELEEVTNVDAVPANVRKLVNRHFRNGQDMKFERKLIAAYEIEGVVDGKRAEHLVTSTGAEIKFGYDDDEEEDDE